MSSAVLVKLDAIKDEMDVRFSHVEREQAGMRDWMERLSNSIERLAEVTSNFLALQQRVSSVERSHSDLALDVDGLDTRMSDIEKKGIGRDLINKVWIALAASGATAAIGKLIEMFLAHH